MITIFPIYLSTRYNLSSKPEKVPGKSVLVLARVLLLVLAMFMCGPLFGELPNSSYFWQQTGPRYAAFFMLFLVWELALAYISHFIYLRRSAKKWLRLLSYLPAFALSLLTFYWLGHFESKTEETIFFVVVALLGIRAMAEGLFLVEVIKPALFLIYVFIFCIANLSAYFITAELTWQFVLLSVSLLSGLLAQSFYSYFFRKGLPEKPAVLLRVHILLLLAGPMIVLALVYFGYLDGEYLAVLFSIGLAIQAAEKSRQLEKSAASATTLKQVEVFSCLSSILFVLTLFAVLFFGS